MPQDLQDVINKYGGKMKQTWGVPVEEIQRGIKNGVRKINVDTDNRLAITGAIRKVFAETPEKFDPRDYLKPARDAMKKVCVARMTSFGQAGWALEDQAGLDRQVRQLLRDGVAGSHFELCVNLQSPDREVGVFLRGPKNAAVNSEEQVVKIRLIVAVAIAIGSNSASLAADWPQWMGPERDNVWREDGHRRRTAGGWAEDCLARSSRRRLRRDQPSSTARCLSPTM